MSSSAVPDVKQLQNYLHLTGRWMKTNLPSVPLAENHAEAKNSLKFIQDLTSSLAITLTTQLQSKWSLKTALTEFCKDFTEDTDCINCIELLALYLVAMVHNGIAIDDYIADCSCNKIDDEEDYASFIADLDFDQSTVN